MKQTHKQTKIKGTPPYLASMNFIKIFHFLFSFFKFVAVAAPDTAYAPPSQIYVTAHPNFL